MKYEVKFEGGNASYPVFEGTREECVEYRKANNCDSNYVIRRKY